jgi:hypothetical protein
VSELQIQEITKRYFKGGLEIKDLALQFNFSEEIIEQVLRNNNIEIIKMILS